MTILFHPNISKLFIGKGILKGGLEADSAITIYSGPQPTPQEILDNWPAFNATNAIFLAHYTSANWTHALGGLSNAAGITKFPADVNASHTGLGAWAILWSTNPAMVVMGGTTIPDTSFIIVPLSTVADKGIVRFDPDAFFTAGESKSIADGVITGLAV